MITNIFCSEISNPILWEHSWPLLSSIDEEISIWKFRISSNEDNLDHFKSLLNVFELKVASKYHFEKDYNRCILGRGITKILLAFYTSQKPKEILIDYEENKKPFLRDSSGFNLSFNLSHSENYILIAVGKDEIGVDIEKMKNLFEYQSLIDAIFTKEEKNFITKAPEPVKAFYLLWTRKEALLKATGMGIVNDLNCIACLNGENKVDSAVIVSKKEWLIKSFQISNNYIASVAYLLDKPINFFEFSF